MPYPDELEALRRLVQEEHTKINDEPLLLAIYYKSALVPEEECLFEVARHFGLDYVSEDREFFQIQFDPSKGLPMAAGHRLRLLLTNSKEMKAAFAQKQSWLQLEDLIQAIQRKEYNLLFSRKKDAEVSVFLTELGLREHGK